MLSIFLVTLFISAVHGIDRPSPTESYKLSESFDSGNIHLYWNYTDTHITFEVHGHTQGWVGIGFSPNGAMTGADMFVGWIKDGKVHVTDRHGIDNTFPPKDPKQDIDVITGWECDGWTMFKFSRQLAACESEFDREITGCGVGRLERRLRLLVGFFQRLRLRPYTGDEHSFHTKSCHWLALNC